MKFKPVTGRFSSIDDGRHLCISIFGFVLLGVSLGDLDHYGIILLDFFIGLVYFSDQEWQDYLNDSA